MDRYDDGLGGLGSLLGRWHQWRRMYSHERGYARIEYEPGNDDDDILERMIMRSIEVQVAEMPRELQLALQHVARAECLGVEVLHHPMLANREARASLAARALIELRRRLLQAGVI